MSGVSALVTFQVVCMAGRRAKALKVLKRALTKKKDQTNIKIICHYSVNVATIRESAWWLISQSQGRVMFSSQPVNNFSCFSGSVPLHLHSAQWGEVR